MADDPRLSELLSEWSARRRQGDPVDLADICLDCPELAPELGRRIVALEWAERIAASGAATGAFVPDTRSGAEVGPPAADAPLPATLGGFRVLGLVGRGGMGAVVRAEDPTLRREVAIKLMHPALAAHPAARDRFIREARAAAAVRHDHVVPIYHVGEDAGTPYLVMPLLAGESLEERLARGPLPPAEVTRVGREAALGLAAAHAKGMIHRDVKPANLWLETSEGRVKVLDFGLARAADASDHLTAAGVVLGTPAYMAPEQADGREVDARADLFSLGAVLYRCATGTPAFDGNSITAILRSAAEHHPPPPHEANPTIPVPLSALIMRLLAKRPAERPVSATAVADELASTSTAATSTAGVAPTRRNRWPVRVAALVILVGLGIALWAATRPPGPATPPTDPPPAAGNPSGGAPSVPPASVK